MGNPIGWLQEMCMSRRWPPPSYDMEHEEGLPHERQFTIACHVLKFREIGTGKSKKLAKRMAAHKMWKVLQELPLEGTNIPPSYDNEDDVSENIVSLYYMSLIYTKNKYNLTSILLILDNIDIHSFIVPSLFS